jgi:hypothetical protein
VPAVTFGVSTNFALANFLASRSFGNVSVALASPRFPRGGSNETYHVPWDLLAMRPSRGLCRRLTAVSGTSIEGKRNRSARQPASPLDSFPAVAGAGQPPTQNAPAALPESWRNVQAVRSSSGFGVPSERPLRGGPTALPNKIQFNGCRRIANLPRWRGNKSIAGAVSVRERLTMR